ncbi:MAG: isochorismatase family protein [Oricola sp.]|jgi:hypothetical protein|nr:isochorismatase family protein [Oricola sp.]
MAGEPIVVAGNCAVVFVEEPFARAKAETCEFPQRSLAADLAEAIAAPHLDLRGESDFIIDSAFIAKFGELKRRSLILFGALLEGAVTQIALSMLLEGYDIYVCADQVKTADAARETIFLERIRHCAGHVVTLPQILLELLSQEEIDKKRQALLAVLNAVRVSR